MPVYEPDKVVHELLSTVSGLTKATVTLPPFDGNLCLCSSYEVEDNATSKAVFVSPQPGGDNARLCGVANDLRKEYVLVVVRGEPGDEAGALTLARACRDALHCANASSYGYFSCVVMDPQPRPQAVDAGGRRTFSFLAELRRLAG